MYINTYVLFSAHNISLKVINISWNKIQLAGALAFADALKVVSPKPCST